MIKRYMPDVRIDGKPVMLHYVESVHRDEDGYVKYSDHLAELERVKRGGYEYKTEEFDGLLWDDDLDIFGADGWALITIEQRRTLVGELKFRYYFMRPIPQPPQADGGTPAHEGEDIPQPPKP